PGRPLGDRADAVLPAVAGDEVPAGVAHHADPELPGQVENVASESSIVGGGVTRLKDTSVDAAAHVLDEGAEESAMHRREDGTPVYDDVRFQGVSIHGRLFYSLFTT